MIRYVLTQYNDGCMSNSYCPIDPKLKLTEIKAFAESRTRITPDDKHILKWTVFNGNHTLFYIRPLRETDHYDPTDYDYDEETDEDGNVITPSGWDTLNSKTYSSQLFTIWDTTKYKPDNQ